MMLAHLQPSLSAADPLHSASWRGDQAILIATSLASAPDLRQPRAVGGACSVCVLQVFGPAAVSNDLAVSASVQATVSPRRRLLTAAAQYQVKFIGACTRGLSSGVTLRLQPAARLHCAARTHCVRVRECTQGY